MTIDVSRTGGRGGLLCRAAGCDGNPLRPRTGWHLVTVLLDGDRFKGLHAFVCNAHLEEAERALAEAMTDEPLPWEVETFRMYGWEDDGRGDVYITARGGGDLTLF
ncbi:MULTISPECIES: hypothetical protein [Pimelobacter]|uniref:hypothetical protein n=1 Tax=Pimelobacter TaxID=2044 RepID=UPI001C04A05D|nr:MULTISPECIES: hypothetical protein [Pimelobacter]MBU2698855.1 hypothetical protein [Pimelobacter sp. 30-1]UUW92985.1 hypothetical protein M0M43_30595 [Pimelobacter simplex]UUW99018.1 hypothetical protein M0M48_30615 [Pimelobacter simplex]